MRVGLRVRLTVIYGALFLLAGVLLLGVNYALVRRNLPPRIQVSSFRAEVPPGEAGNTMVVRGVPPGDIERIESAAEAFRDQTLDQLVLQSGVALAITAVVAVGGGWVVAGRALQPVHEITAAARRLSDRNLHERIALEGPDDELKELADTFDGMLERLDAAFEAQGRFVANAAHELRTPLTILRTELEVAVRDPAADLPAVHQRLVGVVERAEAVVEGLLALARSTHGTLERQPVDLVDVAEVAVAELAGELAPLEVRTSLAPAVTLGDGTLLEHLASNLVSNAARHNVADGWVEVRTGVAGGVAWLEVANSGPVVSADAASLFEPFRRDAPDRTRSARGAGLGLSIVRAVAEAHAGTVDLVALPAGGLRVRAELPRATG